MRDEERDNLEGYRTLVEVVTLVGVYRFHVLFHVGGAGCFGGFIGRFFDQVIKSVKPMAPRFQVRAPDAFSGYVKFLSAHSHALYLTRVRMLVRVSKAPHRFPSHVLRRFSLSHVSPGTSRFCYHIAMTTPPMSPERPIQTYLAEELDPAWLVEQHDYMNGKLPDLTGAPARTMRVRIASNMLELAINQGSPAFLEAAFDDLDHLVKHPEYSVGEPALFKAKTFITGYSAFQARTHRETLSTKVMDTVFADTMGIYDELRFKKVRDRLTYAYMSNIIAFGSLARARDSGRFPCTASFRELSRPGDAAHDLYIREYTSQRPPIKHPAAVHDPKEKLYPVRAADIIHSVSMAHLGWCKRLHLALVGENVKPDRFDALAGLLQWDAAHNSELNTEDRMVLASLTRYFSEQVMPRERRPTKTLPAKRKSTTDPVHPCGETPAPLQDNQLAKQLRQRGFSGEAQGR